MIVLGLSAYVHDSAACLVIDGVLKGNVEEERFNRQKHTAAFPLLSIQYLLQKNGISLSDVDVIAFNWNPWLSLASETLKWLFSPHIAVQVRRLGLSPKNWGSIGNSIRLGKAFEKHFPGEFEGRIEWVDHHIAHAASSYYISPFNRLPAYSLVVDGSGDTASTTLFAINGNKFLKIKSWPISDSLGILYSSVTQFLGLKAHEEGKTMALAAYGENNYKDEFQKILELTGGVSHC